MIATKFTYFYRIYDFPIKQIISWYFRQYYISRKLNICFENIMFSFENTTFRKEINYYQVSSYIINDVEILKI